MSSSHAARIAALPKSRSLDERTWVDLNLDDVFAAIDRTQSTLGQHALYHRLRTAPVADHLEAFEALVDRMTVDPAARERAQMALARLQDPHGYDVLINTCLARDYRAPIFHVRSCIGRTDDLPSGKSYYIAEVEALLELVRASGHSTPHLFLLDELFRGTNAVERIAAGQAVLQELVGSEATTKAHSVLAATHDRELVDLTSTVFDAYHFGDAIGPEGLIFNHRLQPGPATTRNAIALLRLHGAPDSLLAQAATTAELLDRQRGNPLVAR